MGGYPEILQEALARVEETRPKRLEAAKKKKYYPKLLPSEYEDVLKKYHPDYRPEGRRVLKIGPNKGEELQVELVELLEGRPWIEPVDFSSRLRSPDYTTDVLVIGGGIIPDEDIPSLKEIGIAEVFGPGTYTDDIVTYIKNNLKR